MKYDFDRVIPRTNTDSVKWMGLQDRFGVTDALPLWVADMDFESPAPVVQALVQRAQHGIFGYPWRSDAYYSAIVGWLARRHGWRVQRDWITVAPGVVTSLSVAVHALTQPGDKIVIQTPVYPPFFSAVRNNGRQLVRNPLRFENHFYRMDLQDLERKIDKRTKLLILCSPHNPVGRVWSREELAALGEICVRHDLLILSDEIHSDLILSGHRHTPIATISDELAERTLTFLAPSKTFNIPGLGTSFVVTPDENLRTRFKGMAENLGLEAGNVFGLLALQVAFDQGEEWLEQLLDYLAGNLDWATRFIRERIPGIQAVCPEGTYLLWLDCRGLGLEPAALKDFMLRQARVALNDGREFGKEGEGFQRLNVGCPRSVLAEALTRIETAVHSLS